MTELDFEAMLNNRLDSDLKIIATLRYLALFGLAFFMFLCLCGS